MRKNIGHIRVSIGDKAGKSEPFAGVLHQGEPLFIIDPPASYEDFGAIVLEGVLIEREGINNSRKGLINMGKIGNCPRDQEVLILFSIGNEVFQKGFGIFSGIVPVRVSTTFAIICNSMGEPHIPECIRKYDGCTAPTGQKPNSPLAIEDLEFQACPSLGIEPLNIFFAFGFLFAKWMRKFERFPARFLQKLLTGIEFSDHIQTDNLPVHIKGKGIDFQIHKSVYDKKTIEARKKINNLFIIAYFCNNIMPFFWACCEGNVYCLDAFPVFFYLNASCGRKIEYIMISFGFDRRIVFFGMRDEILDQKGV